MEELEELEKTKKLTPKQEMFCQELINNYFNQTEAYCKAYGTDDRLNARKYASKLMTNQDIQARVEELKAEINKKYDVQQGQIIETLTWVIKNAQAGTPEMKMNRDGKFVPTGNKVYDYKAINEAAKNLMTLLGLNETKVKAEIDGRTEVNVVTAKDVASAILGSKDSIEVDIDE